MKIAAIQFKSISGDINTNISKHIDFIKIAVNAGANLVYFPELSITGYEPKQAKELALNLESNIFNAFQNLSDIHNVTIGIGAPLLFQKQVQIGMLWFRKNEQRVTYTKQHLHTDELPYFVAGETQLIIHQLHQHIAPAICYESLLSSHSDNAVNLGSNIYLASVAKSSNGIIKATQHYPEIARKHHIHVVMANSLGQCDDFQSVGHSAAWDVHGNLLGEMDDISEGILLVDIENSSALVIKQ